MATAQIKRVMVVGSGTMGAQIGMLCALAGKATTIQDISAHSLAQARQQLEARMEREVQKGRRTPYDVRSAFDRLTFTTDLETAVEEADCVIEAATERLDVKQEIFRSLDQFAPSHTVLATNSSTLGSSQVAGVTDRGEQVCNMHFFNPALVMRCVEVVRHEQTSDATVEAVMELARQIGQSPVLLHREIPGFIANRLMGAVRQEALSLYSAGIADFEDIDTAAKNALGHPMGPFELMDLVGLDVTYLSRQAAYAESGDKADKPHPAVERLYCQGNYGRKTGRGWYKYTATA